MRYLCLRSINQDALENFFGCIRSHNVRNVNPTSYAFVNSFKSFIINNLSGTRSPGANCETDKITSILSSLEGFLH